MPLFKYLFGILHFTSADKVLVSIDCLNLSKFYRRRDLGGLIALFSSIFLRVDYNQFNL